MARNTGNGPNSGGSLPEIFLEQLSGLGEVHFLILLWAALSEGKSVKYNITNCFDDFKYLGITRTKQTAVAMVEALGLLRFIDIRDERNCKNIYITRYGAQALAKLIESNRFVKKTSKFIEEQ